MIHINYYLLHCFKHKERKKHIKNICSKLDKHINIFEGYYTKNIDINTENIQIYLQNFDNNLKIKSNFSFGLSGQIGCYLSHHLLVKNILQQMTIYNKNPNNQFYSVIFEDDVTWNNINLHIEINQIINILLESEVDWDIVFLGNLNNNHGKLLKGNIYYLNPRINCFGTHALLLNNKNIQKIYFFNCLIRNEIDSHYKFLIDNNKLKGLVIYPPLCFQDTSLLSNIKM
jgi:GR25 family glycosyltransferase involved in LPS biosynthesis